MHIYKYNINPFKIIRFYDTFQHLVTNNIYTKMYVYVCIVCIYMYICFIIFTYIYIYKYIYNIYTNSYTYIYAYSNETKYVYLIIRTHTYPYKHIPKILNYGKFVRDALFDECSSNHSDKILQCNTYLLKICY
jgi:hypothetical protein